MPAGLSRAHDAGMPQNSLTGSALPSRPHLSGPDTAPEAASLLARARRSPRLGVIVVAAAAFAVEMAVSARYGYHRDELYFLEAGHHPAFGYVDQPPLTPLAARLAALLFANSLVGLRVLPALGLSALVLLTAGMSRILGAGRAGQVLAAVCVAGCAEYLGCMHLLTTTTPDFVAWGVLLYLVLRLLDSGEPRWWLAIGLCTGVAAEAKWTIWFLAGSVVAGFAVTPQRRLLRSRYLLLGAVIAVALAGPDLIWQAAHGWPNLDVFRSLHTAAGHNRATYWQAQVLFTGLALTPVWVAGLIWILRSDAPRRFRPAVIGAAAAIVITFILGGKPYYSGGAYTVLLAAGSVPAGRWLFPGTGRRWGRWGLLAAGAVVTLAAVPIAIPVLPAVTLHTVPLQTINYDLAETIAWPREVALIAREYHALPAAQRDRTTILAGNYGEAGAVERYGPGLGLPAVYSGSNNFWLWGPPPAADRSAIAISLDPSLLRREFRHVRQIATFYNGLGVNDDEQGAPVYLATGLRESWARAWPAFRDYG
jgi:4-amino-4-deoxy-L-arabinose transferase-like glycosyltransferase